MAALPLVDLAVRSIGGSAMLASDESFGEKENLLVPSPPQVVPGSYGHKGELVDGWETRRRRSPGHDWVLVRLGAPGVIDAVDIDTTGFTGNFPASARVEACDVGGYPSPADLDAPEVEWHEIVPAVPLVGDRSNAFDVAAAGRCTHVRLSIFPDGGVARLRVYGRVVPDRWRFLGITVDLAAVELGGLVVASSDDFYSSAGVLNLPGLARHMGEGWETRRRRGPGHDWVVVRLAGPGRVRMVEVDTSYFKYNASAECALFGWAAGAGSVGPSEPSGPSGSSEPSGDGWLPLVARRRLEPDTRHFFPVDPYQVISHVRLDAYPDGGISRLRVLGELANG
jgi:allantoicase